MSELLSTIAKAYDKDMQEYLAYLPHFNGKIPEIRNMGYTFITALLELIDNSVRKNCYSSYIDIILHADTDNKKLFRISVLDDGIGMSFNELKQALIYNFKKERANGDIGKYHIGMKYAGIVIGNNIIILSRRSDGTISGIYLDIEQMCEHNTYTPTDVRENVDDKWALKYIHPNDYEKFKQQKSGTLISIKNLTPMCKQNIEKVKNALLKVLPFSYSMLYNDCKVNLYENTNIIQTIKPYDLFYHNSPDCLDEPAYETTLNIYNDFDGYRVVEINENKRMIENPTKNKKESECRWTDGAVDKPAYYEFTQYIKTGGRTAKNFRQIDTLPDSDTLFTVINLRYIQVNKNIFISEKEQFLEDSKLGIDRKGSFFIRGIRNVSAGHQLGMKISDRTIMAIERQRCLVTFESKADDLIGSKYNKDIDINNKLPCIELNDALHAIYKQVTSPWTRKHPGKKKNKKNENDEGDSDIDEEDKNEEILAPVAHIVAPVAHVAPVARVVAPVARVVAPVARVVAPVTPIASDVTPIAPYNQNSSDDETDNISDTSSIIEDDIIINTPHIPFYSYSLENGNIIFMEDDQPYGTLNSPPKPEGLCAWFKSITQLEYKKYSHILLQAQEFY